MLRGMYDFLATNDKMLGFESNEQLLYLGSLPTDKNWLKASNARGQVGLVPVNYVTIDHDFKGEIIIDFINKAIRMAQNDKSMKISDLLKHRDRILKTSTDIKDQIIELEDEIRRARHMAIAELSNSESPIVSRDADDLNDRVRTFTAAAAAAQVSSLTDYHRSFVNEEPDLSPSPPASIILPGVERGSYMSDNHLVYSSAGRRSLDRSTDRDWERERDSLVGSSRSHISQYSSNNHLGSRHSGQTYPMSSTTTLNSHGNSLSGLNNISTTAATTGSISVSSSITNQSPAAHIRMAGELIEAVRSATGLSHELSQTAVQTVVQYMQGHFDGMSSQLNGLMTYLETPCAIRNYPNLITQSPDAIKLREVFTQLTECKDDEQQRSWALHEDESMIKDNIRHLNGILRNADNSISKFVMQENHYNSVHTLVLYYQMETRMSIRQLLLEAFASMALIDSKALSVLLNSVLPMQLGRELQVQGCDRDKLIKIANLLSLLCSTGESMPITHYEHLGTDFLHFVFNTIEDPPNDDEEITDTLMNVILAYNLQFMASDQNFTIQALTETPNAKIFTQKLIYLLNYERDPVSTGFMFESKAPHSVFKLLIDIFTCNRTAELFYTNDVKVLIDIVTRCLTDLGPGDKRRTSYLTLIRMIFRNSNYSEHQHRRDDIIKCFTSILVEDDPLSVPDQRLIREITLEFPNIVKLK